MTLTGQFRDATRHPYPSIEGRIAITGTGAVARTPFLLDTGAEITFLMPTDAAALGIDFDTLTPTPHLVSSVGGDTRLYQVSASITFSDAENLYVYRTELAIAEPGEHNRRLPSLLGRDILNRWHLRYDAPANALEAEVASADLVIPRRR